MDPSSSQPSVSGQACTVLGGGFLGVFIGFFCPLCVPGSVAFLSAIGLSFVAQAQLIFPLVALFAVVLLYGLGQGYRRHAHWTPVVFGILGVFAIPLGRYVLSSPYLTYFGAFSVIVSSVLNILLIRKNSKNTMGVLRSSAPVQNLAMFAIIMAGTLTTVYFVKLQDKLGDVMLGEKSMAKIEKDGTMIDGSVDGQP